LLEKAEQELKNQYMLGTLQGFIRAS